MSRFLPALVALSSLLFGLESAVAQRPIETIAVTEFMNSPIGEYDARTWIELYNFGKDPVDLNKFSITDGKNDIIELPEAKIQPGDYVVIPVGHDGRRWGDEKKKLFEAEWLGGKEDPRVLAVDGRLHLDSADGLTLLNRRKVPIWLMGWRSDAAGGFSTYLAEPNWDVRNYGSFEKPAINRKGMDGTVKGYEGQHAAKEDVAWKSDVTKLEAIGGILYQTKEAGGRNEPSIGSPLKGNYKQKE